MLNASPRSLRFKMASKMTRETNTAVNRFASRPKVNVTANPRTGPVPKRNRITAETMVVRAPQAGHVLAAEDLPQHPHGQEERRPARPPAPRLLDRAVG